VPDRPARATPRRRSRVRRAGALTAVVVATVATAATVHASLVRSGAVLTGVPVRSTVLTSGAFALTARPLSTLRTTTVTVPPGERHLIVARLSAQHDCKNLVAEATCVVQIVIGSGVATPGPLELPVDSKGALLYEAVRGSFGPGTYTVALQWGAVGADAIFALNRGYAFTIEQIRVA